MSTIIRGLRLRPIRSEDGDRLVALLSNRNVAGSSQDLRDARLLEPEHWHKVASSKAGRTVFVVQDPENGVIGLAPVYNVSLADKTAFAGVTILDERLRASGYGYTAKLLQMKFAFSALKLEKVFEDISQEESSLISYYVSRGYENLGKNERGGFRLSLSSGTWHDSLARELST